MAIRRSRPWRGCRWARKATSGSRRRERHEGPADEYGLEGRVVDEDWTAIIAAGETAPSSSRATGALSDQDLIETSSALPMAAVACSSSVWRMMARLPDSTPGTARSPRALHRLSPAAPCRRWTLRSGSFHSQPAKKNSRLPLCVYRPFGSPSRRVMAASWCATRILRANRGAVRSIPMSWQAGGPIVGVKTCRRIPWWARQR